MAPYRTTRMDVNTAGKKRILLVMPDWRSATSQWTPNDHPYLNKKALMPPLSLATIAALTPEDFETDIWDESVHGFIDDDTRFPVSYDIVGIGGYYTHIFRVKILAEIFKRRGDFLVAGGAGVTAAPKEYRAYFDVIILGESEYIWPQFLHDFLEGNYKRIYKEINPVNMIHSPKPKWGNIKASMSGNYTVGAVQTTRGCPFSCSFCNEWKVFGRKVRTKTTQQVIEEIEELSNAGLKQIVFGVDNFYGNHKYAREILAALINFNKTQAEPLHFITQISVTIAADDEFLKMMADAGFNGLFIGIESPKAASLIESKKLQNLKGDLVENCKKILSYGLPVEASMIVGFDEDDEGIFDAQFDFIQKSCIPYPRIRLLQAKPGTDLFDRLILERRVLDTSKLHLAENYFDTFLISNIIPASMTRVSLFENYIKLLDRLFDMDNFTERMIGYIDLITYVPERENKEDVRITGGKLPAGLIDFICKIDQKERACVEKILNYAASKVPHQLNNIVGLIVRQQFESQNVEITKKTILSQIEFERNLDLSQCILEISEGVEVL